MTRVRAVAALALAAGAAAGCSWPWQTFQGGTPVPGAQQLSCADPATPGCGMVAVPAGRFDMGDPDPTTARAQPVFRNVHVTKPLAVDAYEVTVARFRAFWTATRAGTMLPGVMPAYSNSQVVDLSGVAPGAVAREPTRTTARPGCNWSPAPGDRDAQPVNCVAWYAALAFCSWDASGGTPRNTGRLPTEAEFEWISRWWPVDGLPVPRTYPWGNDDPHGTAGGACDRAQWFDCAGDADGGTTRRVGSFAPTGGIYDLAGNVREWTVDTFTASYAAPCWNNVLDPICDPIEPLDAGRSTRGGDAHIVNPAFLRGAARTGCATIDSSVAATAPCDPTAGTAYTGFRCVRALRPGT